MAKRGRGLIRFDSGAIEPSTRSKPRGIGLKSGLFGEGEARRSKYLSRTKLSLPSNFILLPVGKGLNQIVIDRSILRNRKAKGPISQSQLSLQDIKILRQKIFQLAEKINKTAFKKMLPHIRIAAYFKEMGAETPSGFFTKRELAEIAQAKSKKLI